MVQKKVPLRVPMMVHLMVLYLAFWMGLNLESTHQDMIAKKTKDIVRPNAQDTYVFFQKGKILASQDQLTELGNSDGPW